MNEVPYDPEQGEFSEDNELSHSDKAAGVITEPGVTFSETAKYPPRAKDWLIPLGIYIILFVTSQIIQFSNPVISYDAKKKQIEAMEKSLDAQVQKGEMSREQADQFLEGMGRMNFFIFRIIGSFFGFIVFFFIIAALYYVFGRFVFKGDGNYSSALVSMALPLYIGIIEILIYTIAALVMLQGMANASIGSFLDIMPDTGFGLLMWLLNPIAIWMNVVVAVGLARMYKRSVLPFIVLVFVFYVLSMLLIYAMS
jgi:hypothetical protein